MHGYMMPSIALKNNPQIIFTWLHYAATTGARMPAKSGNSRLCAISSQKLGEELPINTLLAAPRLFAPGGVAPPRHSAHYASSARLARHENPQADRVSYLWDRTLAVHRPSAALDCRLCVE